MSIMARSRGVQAAGRFDSATLGLDRFDFDPDPNLPTLSVAPTFVLDASRLGARFRDGESIPYFYDLTSSPGNAQYTRLPAGAGANPAPILVRTRPHAGGLSVISFDHIQYYQADFTGMVSSGNSYHYQSTISQWSDAYTVQAGDVLVYDIYIPSSDGSFNVTYPYIALDLPHAGGALRDSGAVDQNGFSAHANAFLSSVATDKWYQRRIPFPSGWVGDTFGIDVVCEADTGGSFRARFRNVHVLRADGTRIYLGQGASWRNNPVSSASHSSSCSFPATTTDDQSGWYAMTADLASALVRPVTYFAVVYGWPNVGGGRNVIDGQDARNAVYWSSSGSVWAMYAGTNERFGVTAESQPMDDAVAVAATFNSTASTLWRAGAVEFTGGTTVGTASLDRLRVGTWNEGEGGGQWSDWIGEILVYDGTLTDLDVHRVGAYLRDKWGVAWTTPVPQFVSASTIKAATGATTSTAPASTQVGDVVIMAVWTNASNTIATPTGYTAIAGAESDANMSCKFFWRRLDGTLNETVQTVTPSGTALSTTNGLFIRQYAYRYCKMTGDPYENASVSTPAQSTTPSTGTMNASGDNRLGVSIVVVDDDPTWSSGMPPALWTNNGTRTSSTTGGDGMTDSISREVDTTASTVNFGVMSLNVYWSRLSLCLVPL